MDPNLIQARRDICKKCKAPCPEKALGTVPVGNPCASCPIGRWGHIDGDTDCTDVIPDFVHPTCPQVATASAAKVGGAGTELKAMLAVVGIVPTPTCACNDRAAQMDQMGTDWCEANIEHIVGWMAEEARARRLPMPHVVGVQLVKSAIRKARRKMPASTMRS